METNQLLFLNISIAFCVLFPQIPSIFQLYKPKSFSLFCINFTSCLFFFDKIFNPNSTGPPIGLGLIFLLEFTLIYIFFQFFSGIIKDPYVLGI